MKLSQRIVTLAGAGSAASLACALAFAALPALPADGQVAPVSTVPPPGVDAPPEDASAAFEAARRGVTVLEQAGRVVGLGTVLGADPRILVALSSLGGSDGCDVRYADGSLVRARLVHRDEALDLGLLVPLSGRYSAGLPASELDPVGRDLRTFSPNAQRRPALAPSRAKGRVDVRTRDGLTLPSMLELDGRAPALLGAPIVDTTGAVVAVTVRVCAPTDAALCVPAVVGAPLAILRGFLAKTPPDAVPPSPWLGIQGAPDAAKLPVSCPPNKVCAPADSEVRGVRVLAVAPGSAALAAGLRAGDLIEQIDDQVTETPERLQELIAAHAVGEVVRARVISGEKRREQRITLRAAP